MDVLNVILQYTYSQAHEMTYSDWEIIYLYMTKNRRTHHEFCSRHLTRAYIIADLRANLGVFSRQTYGELLGTYAVASLTLTCNWLNFYSICCWDVQGLSSTPETNCSILIDELDIRSALKQSN
jgi:hypothetical protein